MMFTASRSLTRNLSAGVALALAFICMPVLAHGDQKSQEQRRAAWETMSPEEREAKHREMRGRWESMSAEERDAKRSEMRRRWESMSDEERTAARARRGERGGHGRSPS